jgi:TPR repeat protein
MRRREVQWCSGWMVRMCKLRILLAIVAGLLLMQPGYAQDNAVLAACDAAAGAPASEDLPAGVPGVPPWKVDPKVAVPACEAAARLAPDNPRIAYQLGRAYMAEKSFGLAFAAFTRADQRGYALATFNLAVMYKGGKASLPMQ